MGEMWGVLAAPQTLSHSRRRSRGGGQPPRHARNGPRRARTRRPAPGALPSGTCSCWRRARALPPRTGSAAIASSAQVSQVRRDRREGSAVSGAGRVAGPGRSKPGRAGEGADWPGGLLLRGWARGPDRLQPLRLQERGESRWVQPGPLAVAPWGRPSCCCRTGLGSSRPFSAGK